MRRSLLLVLIAVLAVAVAAPAMATAGAAPDTQASAKKKGKAKKKAAKCKTAKKKAKGKAKGKGRKSLATDSAKRKAKGKAKAKRKSCGKAKPKTTPRRVSPRKRHHSPIEEKFLERLKQRQERRESRPPAPTIKDMVPADGTYTAAAAPGLTVTISAGGTQARVVYTVPKTAFSTECQAHTEGVLVDLSGELSPSQSTQRGYIMFNDSRPMPDSRSWGVQGSIGKDGSFTMSVTAGFPYPPDPNASCSGYAQLTGQLVT